jgi:predicted anti-sigma-YlaC factor YlaD
MTSSCEAVRTALSARLDGLAGEGGARVDTHLAACGECQAWLTAAEAVGRSMRAQPSGVPDLTAPILAAVAADRARTRAERRRILQVALALSALVQVALAIPSLFLPGGDAFVHVGREAASFDIALAVGFALAARRPERARAFVTVAFVLAGCLTLTSVFDIARGVAVPAHEIAHIAALAQAGLLLALARMTPSRGRGSAATVLP